MAIYLDDVAMPWSGPDLGSVLEAATQALAPKKRLVVEVQLNGRVLQPDELPQRSHDPVAGADLRLYSANPKELAADTLRDVRMALSQLRETQQRAAELFQQDQQRPALEKVREFVEIWQQSQRAVEQATALVGLRLDEVKLKDDTAGAVVKHLAEQLQALTRLIKAGDTVAMADALAYEWPGTVDRWDRLLAGLIRRIEK